LIALSFTAIYYYQGIVKKGKVGLELRKTTTHDLNFTENNDKESEAQILSEYEHLANDYEDDDD
jgi:hypothetical protein